RPGGAGAAPQRGGRAPVQRLPPARAGGHAQARGRRHGVRSQPADAVGAHRVDGDPRGLPADPRTQPRGGGELLMQRVLTLDPVHDSRHRLRPEPLARESLVFMLQLPEEDIAAFVYTWVSGESKAGTALCVYGPGIGDEPLFEIVDGIAVPSDQGFDDWRVGGLHSRHVEPLETADVTVNGERASLEYRFEAMHPAYAYGMHRDGCPQWMADERFEQSGRVSGVL